MKTEFKLKYFVHTGDEEKLSKSCSNVLPQQIHTDIPLSTERIQKNYRN